MSLESITYGPFRLDLESGQFFRLELPVGEPLTDTERRVLATIMAANGEVALYKDFPLQNPDYVVWYVKAITNKLGSSFGRHIHNERGKGYRFELQPRDRDLSGRRLHIAGSGIKNLEYAHALTRALVREAMRVGAGFVVSAGGDPQIGGKSQIFDWTVLETAHGLLKTTQWFGSGKRIINVHADEIAGSRVALWRSLLLSGEAEHFILPQNPRIGDAVEDAQARFGDVLIAMGGRLGVEMLAKRYRLQRKHVVPLDVDLGSRSGSGYKFASAQTLRAQALQEHCEGWFSLRDDSVNSPVVLLELTTTDAKGVEEVCSRILELLLDLSPPYCLVIFPAIDIAPESAQWCEEIAVPVLRKFGFRVVRAEARSVSTQLFRGSALTLIDITGLDPHCLFQAGAAFGAAVNFVWTGREGASVPFSTPPVFRWSQPTENIQKEADRFSEYLTSYFRRRTVEGS